MRFAFFLYLICSVSFAQKICRETLRHVSLGQAYSMENLHPFTGQGFAVVSTPDFLDAHVAQRIHEKMMEYHPEHNPSHGRFVERMMSIIVDGEVSFHVRQSALAGLTLAEVGLGDLAPKFARHQHRLFEQLKAALPPDEAAELYLAHFELRWFRGEPEGESISTGHTDGGKGTAFTITTALLGRGTFVQPGVLAQDFQEGSPVYETPAGHSLVLSVNRAAFYRTEVSPSLPGLIPTVHDRPPLDDKPRLILVERYAYRRI